jgi:hypothetical protein
MIPATYADHSSTTPSEALGASAQRALDMRTALYTSPEGSTFCIDEARFEKLILDHAEAHGTHPDELELDSFCLSIPPRMHQGLAELIYEALDTGAIVAGCGFDLCMLRVEALDDLEEELVRVCLGVPGATLFSVTHGSPLIIKRLYDVRGMAEIREVVDEVIEQAELLRPTVELLSHAMTTRETTLA